MLGEVEDAEEKDRRDKSFKRGDYTKISISNLEKQNERFFFPYTICQRKKNTITLLIEIITKGES